MPSEFRAKKFTIPPSMSRTMIHQRSALMRGIREVRARARGQVLARANVRQLVSERWLLLALSVVGRPSVLAALRAAARGGTLNAGRAARAPRARRRVRQSSLRRRPLLAC